jgi:hypothetical protein
MLTLPIARRGNLNINELVTTIPAGNEYLGRVNVHPDSFGSSDVTLDLTFAYRINHSPVVLEDVRAGCQPRWGTQVEKASYRALHIFRIRFSQAVQRELQCPTIEIWNADRCRNKPVGNVRIGLEWTKLGDVHGE